MDCVVRAGLHAGFAANTAIGIEINDAILTAIHGADRADRNAGRLLTMIAACDLENAASIRENTFLYVFDPGAIHSDRHVILCLARDGAGMATNALAIIDDESVFHRELLFINALRVLHLAPHGSTAAIKKGFKGSGGLEFG